MKLIHVPDDLVGRLVEASNSQGKSLLDYITEIFEQALRAHELDCSLKETVDSYERIATQNEEKETEETTKETQQLEMTIDKAFERMLESKLRLEITEKRKVAEER